PALDAAVILTRLGVGAAVGWAAYAWGAHVLTLGCVWRGSHAARRVALTFDDGPDRDWTPRVLDLLAARRALGSFFLVGERAAQVPDAVRRMVAEGHEVGSHGWCHRSLWLCGPRRTADEIDRAHATLAALTGREPRYFRPPWGMVNAAMFGALRRRGERCVFWSIQSEGLRAVAAEDQVRHVLRRAHSGAIVDLHDAEGTRRAPERLVQALPAMIDGLRAAARVPFERARVLERTLVDDQVLPPGAPNELEADPLRRAMAGDQAERAGDQREEREHRGEHDERGDVRARPRAAAHEDAGARRHGARGEDEGGVGQQRLELGERRQRRSLARRRALARGDRSEEHTSE